MTEKMRDGIIRRGDVYYYVLRERGRFPAKDREGNPKLDADRNQIFNDTRQRWIKGANTKAETKGMRDAARNAVNVGTYVPPRNLTVSEWLDRWIESHEVTIKPSTAAYYRGKIPYLKRSIGFEQLQSLSPAGLSVVWRDLVAGGGKGGKPLDVSTVAGARRTLSKALNDAVVERVLQINPVVGSKMPKADLPHDDDVDVLGRTAWSEKQLHAFLEHLDDERWAPLWHLFAGSGMRRGEGAGLRWSEVSLQTGEVRVRRNAVQIGKEVITGSPKSRRGRRTFKLDERTLNALKAWKAQQAEERLICGTDWADTEGLIFTWPDGCRVLPDYMTKEFIKVQERVGARLEAEKHDRLPRLVLHELRHTHTTILLCNNVPPHVVAYRVGDDPATLLRTYAHVIPDADTSAVDVFTRAVWGA